jgi:hypothetical protein
MADVARAAKKRQRTKRIFNTNKTMNAENINEAITLFNEYQLFNEIYRRASQIKAEVCELARRYGEAKCDVERMSIADEIDTKINHLYGFGQAVNNLESKIEYLISNIEDL